MAPKTTTSTARALLLQKCGMEKKKKGSAISNISICNQTYEYIITEDKNVHVNAKESKQYCWKGAFSCSLFLLKHIPVLDGIICQGSSGTLLWLCVILTYKKDMTQHYNVVTLSIVNSVRSIINNTNHSFGIEGIPACLMRTFYTRIFQNLAYNFVMTYGIVYYFSNLFMLWKFRNNGIIDVM